MRADSTHKNIKINIINTLANLRDVVAAMYIIDDYTTEILSCVYSVYNHQIDNEDDDDAEDTLSMYIQVEALTHDFKFRTKKSETPWQVYVLDAINDALKIRSVREYIKMNDMRITTPISPMKLSGREKNAPKRGLNITGAPKSLHILHEKRNVLDIGIKRPSSLRFTNNDNNSDNNNNNNYGLNFELNSNTNTASTPSLPPLSPSLHELNRINNTLNTLNDEEKTNTKLRPSIPHYLIIDKERSSIQKRVSVHRRNNTMQPLSLQFKNRNNNRNRSRHSDLCSSSSITSIESQCDIMNKMMFDELQSIKLNQEQFGKQLNIIKATLTEIRTKICCQCNQCIQSTDNGAVTKDIDDNLSNNDDDNNINISEFKENEENAIKRMYPLFKDGHQQNLSDVFERNIDQFMPLLKSHEREKAEKVVAQSKLAELQRKIDPLNITETKSTKFDTNKFIKSAYDVVKNDDEANKTNNNPSINQAVIIQREDDPHVNVLSHVIHSKESSKYRIHLSEQDIDVLTYVAFDAAIYNAQNISSTVDDNNSDTPLSHAMSTPTTKTYTYHANALRLIDIDNDLFKMDHFAYYEPEIDAAKILLTSEEPKTDSSAIEATETDTANASSEEEEHKRNCLVYYAPKFEAANVLLLSKKSKMNPVAQYPSESDTATTSPKEENHKADGFAYCTSEINVVNVLPSEKPKLDSSANYTSETDIVNTSPEDSFYAMRYDTLNNLILCYITEHNMDINTLANKGISVLDTGISHKQLSNEQLSVFSSVDPSVHYVSPNMMIKIKENLPRLIIEGKRNIMIQIREYYESDALIKIVINIEFISDQAPRLIDIDNDPFGRALDEDGKSLMIETINNATIHQREDTFTILQTPQTHNVESPNAYSMHIPSSKHIIESKQMFTDEDDGTSSNKTKIWLFWILLYLLSIITWIDNSHITFKAKFIGNKLSYFIVSRIYYLLMF